jgi:hypothetical protein
MKRKSFRYEHRKSTGGMFDLPAQAHEKHFYLRLGNWSIREAHGAHILRATLGNDLILKPPSNRRSPPH